jgi:hypothetical protein
VLFSKQFFKLVKGLLAHSFIGQPLALSHFIEVPLVDLIGQIKAVLLQDAMRMTIENVRQQLKVAVANHAMLLKSSHDAEGRPECGERVIAHDLGIKEFELCVEVLRTIGDWRAIEQSFVGCLLADIDEEL